MAFGSKSRYWASGLHGRYKQCFEGQNVGATKEKHISNMTIGIGWDPRRRMLRWMCVYTRGMVSVAQLKISLKKER